MNAEKLTYPKELHAGRASRNRAIEKKKVQPSTVVLSENKPRAKL
jgi:hypothetical protein